MEPFSISALLDNSFTLYLTSAALRKKPSVMGKLGEKKVALLDTGAQVPSLGEIGIRHRVVKGTKAYRTLRRYGVIWRAKRKIPSLGAPQILGSAQVRR